MRFIVRGPIDHITVQSGRWTSGTDWLSAELELCVADAITRIGGAIPMVASCVS